ncbi:MAG: HAMP domain-containing histidine kinase [Elusimicrobiales bacterium]|nr:HAMP domain-containing histidine kinase [Elusimicrobiales bacterium]
MKIRVKFVLFVSILTLLFAAVMVAERATGLSRAMLLRSQDRADHLTSVISELSAHYLETGNISRLKEVLRTFDHFTNITYMRVSDSSGRTVYRMAEQGARFTEKAPDPDVFHHSDGIFDTSRDITGAGVFLGTVQLGLSVKGVQEAVIDMVWRGALIALAFTLFISATAWFLSVKLGKELTWLLNLAENVESQRLPQLTTGPLGSDTGRIARTLHDLHTRLKEEHSLRLDAEADRNDFFEMTVHDLKQPVTALKAALDLLLSDKERKGFNAEQLEMLKEIARKSLGMLTTMIADVLNTAKLNNPDYQPERERIDLLDLLKSCVPENEASVSAAAKKWGVEFGPELEGAWVFGDADLIRRVIGNLVLNAIQYTPEGGRIKLGARMHDKDRVAVYVSDEGAGIPDNFREEIFKKYSTMSKSSKNIGLGLAFCKLVAERHSAFLDVRSERGKGTEISFVLPVYRKDRATPDADEGGK